MTWMPSLTTVLVVTAFVLWGNIAYSIGRREGYNEGLVRAEQAFLKILMDEEK